VELACCVAYIAVLANISNITARNAKIVPLLALIGLSPPLELAFQAQSHYFIAGGDRVGWLSACLAGFPSWNGRIIPKYTRDVKMKW
jgi:hypothetical protein